jgi:hypothetical protein
MKDYYLFLNSPLGYIKLTSDEVSLRSIEFIDMAEELNASHQPAILKKAEVQLLEYFEGKRFSFELDLNPEGTTFQKQVWQLVKNVAFGKTKSYNDIAKEISSLINKVNFFCRNNDLKVPEALNSAGEMLSSAHLNVGIIGAFNSGKSTLLNCMIGKDILPRGFLPTTAIAIELSIITEIIGVFFKTVKTEVSSIFIFLLASPSVL